MCFNFWVFVRLNPSFYWLSRVKHPLWNHGLMRLSISRQLSARRVWRFPQSPAASRSRWAKHRRRAPGELTSHPHLSFWQFLRGLPAREDGLRNVGRGWTMVPARTRLKRRHKCDCLCPERILCLPFSKSLRARGADVPSAACVPRPPHCPVLPFLGDAAERGRWKDGEKRWNLLGLRDETSRDLVNFPESSSM